MFLIEKNLTTLFSCAVLGITCLFSPKASANPSFNLSLANEENENLNISNGSFTGTFNQSNYSSFNNSLEPVYSLEFNRNNSLISPLTHEEKPDIESCDCAADLQGESGDNYSLEIQEIEQFYQAQDNNNLEDYSQPSLNETFDSSEEIQVYNNDNERWHFKFQPYVTVPVTTYGTVTARGRTVNYHLSLGQLLDVLRVTASGRLEAWKGPWGFIVDGYFVNLKAIGNLQGSGTRTPNTINALNYLLSKDNNTKAQEIAERLNQNVENLRTKVENFQTTVATDLEKIRELQQNIEDVKIKVEGFQETVASDGEKLQELQQNIENIQDKISEGQQIIEDRDFRFEQSDRLNLDQREIKKLLILNNQNLQRLPEQETLNNKITKVITGLEGLESLRQQLIETRDTLEQASQNIEELRSEKENELEEKLEQLNTEIDNAKTLLNQDIQKIEQLKDFQENRLPQQLNANSNTELQFTQGIYDFAISYHIGDPPMYELPETPSNRSYPLVWFQPIAGVRLNDINVNIDETFELQLSSSLVNIEGTLQTNYSAGRTWFEPMLGGKLGVQLSDPVILWLRGDVSGFGLAGDTNLSWNVFFGLDWWVRRNLSLQFAYRFYEINYKNGSGNNAFGFEENFNGPYLSATFHF